jgi:cytochrome c556
MPNKLALAAIILWLLTAAAAGVFFVRGNTAPASDGRLAILLAPAERDFVLAEMREMLSATQRVTQALAEGDRASASAAARAASSHDGKAMPLGLMAKPPLDFKTAGMAMHAGFGELAKAAEAGETVPALTGRLAKNIDACVGCHQTYRIDPAR